MLAVSATGLATSTAMLAMSSTIVSHLIVIIFVKKKNYPKCSIVHAFFLNQLMRLVGISLLTI